MFSFVSWLLNFSLTYDQKDIGDLDRWHFSLTRLQIDHPTASICVTSLWPIGPNPSATYPNLGATYPNLSATYPSPVQPTLTQVQQRPGCNLQLTPVQPTANPVQPNTIIPECQSCNYGKQSLAAGALDTS